MYKILVKNETHEIPSKLLLHENLSLPKMGITETIARAETKDFSLIKWTNFSFWKSLKLKMKTKIQKKHTLKEKKIDNGQADTHKYLACCISPYGT